MHCIKYVKKENIWRNVMVIADYTNLICVRILQCNNKMNLMKNDIELVPASLLYKLQGWGYQQSVYLKL